MHNVQTASTRANRYKVAGALLLILAAAGGTWRGWSSSRPSAAINNGSSYGSPMGPRNPATTGSASLSSAASAGSPAGFPELTAQQRAAMEKAREESKGDPRAMREAMDRVLTPDQREKFRQTMAARMAEMDARMKKAMSPADYEAFQRKRQSGALPGPGGPPPGGGVPPPPQ